MFNLCPLKDKKVHVVQGHLKSHQSDEAVQDFRKKCVFCSEQVEQTKADDTIVHVGTCSSKVSAPADQRQQKNFEMQSQFLPCRERKEQIQGGQLEDTRRKQYVICIQR